ncbi:hypothetical protein MPSEU_000103100 [Mayamaea pseudoterrestris]|nr:hypothetical protein MPSEU_000103100 [Mayamaea pseudoterrestris]
MTFVQWMKRRRAAIVEASTNNSNHDGKNSPRRRCRLLNRTESIALDETLSLSTTTDDAQWRIENLLPTGAPRSSDWWVELTEMERDQEEEANGFNEGDGDQVGPQFRNCGLDIWNQGRSAWRGHDEDPVTADGPSLLSSSKPYLSISQRRELMRGLATGRTYQMRQSVSLKEIVQTYNIIWNDDL